MAASSVTGSPATGWRSHALHRRRRETAEAGHEDGYRVGPSRERPTVNANRPRASVCHDVARPVRTAAQRDARPGQHAAGRIDDHPRDLSGLRGRRSRHDQQVAPRAPCARPREVPDGPALDVPRPSREEMRQRGPRRNCSSGREVQGEQRPTSERRQHEHLDDDHGDVLVRVMKREYSGGRYGCGRHVPTQQPDIRKSNSAGSS